MNMNFLLRPGRGAEYCDQLVCPRAFLWNRWTDLREFFCADPLWPRLGSPVAALRYIMYFWFMDDVTFGRSGSYRDAWKAEPLTYYTTITALRYRGGVW